MSAPMSNVVLTSLPKEHHHRPGRRTSQHLRSSDARLGSPTSIPSSPTSIHSSSSAIFERDIEPISPPSPPIHTHRPLDPHRIPRAHTTEQLEQSVPSVLDSAAALLTNIEEEASERISVVAPATSIFETLAMSPSGFASPLSLRSRSPSPLGLRGAPGRADSLLLLNLPLPSVGQASVVVPQPVSASLSTTPSVVTASLSTTSGNDVDPEPSASATSSPSSRSTQSPHHKGDTLSPNSANVAVLGLAHSSPLSSPTSLSHPPSPTHAATKRLSFMSYSDLLSSTPASTHTLSSLTTSASTFEPPPHIPSVSGLNLVSATASVASASASAAGSLRGFSLLPTGGLTHPGKRDSIAMLDNIGGEWEREGMGKGLEERLEGATSTFGTSPSPAVGTSALPVYVGGKV